ncbi:MAG: Gfo/Idh/MocA family oxidoreductase [Ardenticatenaceae bacterium]|nr:Gfo/Idh/MocA family oxidoreductase [Ardenticatenaceae bacterium]MCB9446592.1 Gfo/Idh/MocA family oxidoreductase [Ardenticatenaceae bacterium]
MVEKIRWGLLSTANINRRVIPAIRMSARGELTAVASRSQAKSDAYAAQWEIPQAFGSYEAMLESDAVDAVYIGLPNRLHAEWSIKAMRAGKHVLCEKPFALTLAEVDEMTAVSQQTGMKLAEAFMYRHHPQTKIVGEWVRNGRLGDIVLVRSHFSFKLENLANVRMIPELGGGSLWDVGVYPLSLAQFVMGGAPQQVWGRQWVGASSGVDESFAGQMDYGNGRVAQISSGFRTPFHTWAEIIGTNGRLTLNRPFIGLDERRQLLFYHPDDTIEEVRVPQQELYLGEIEDMHAAIFDDQPNYLTLAETRNHIRTVLALYESAQTGRVVHLA